MTQCANIIPQLDSWQMSATLLSNVNEDFLKTFPRFIHVFNVCFYLNVYYTYGLDARGQVSE